LVLFANADEARALLITYHPALLEANTRKPFSDDGVCLVRPDGYVALAANRDALDDLARYLDGLALAPSAEPTHQGNLT
jgi:hypothetical protein